MWVYDINEKSDRGPRLDDSHAQLTLRFLWGQCPLPLPPWRPVRQRTRQCRLECKPALQSSSHGMETSCSQTQR
jgi:hypothetical protein